MHRRDDIQGLRALAVLSVVVAHAGASLFSGGFVGVDLFFVVSGFLITDLLIRESERTDRIALPRFWARRVRRLLPASTLVLIATAIAAAIVLPLSRRAEVGVDILWSALFAANWRFVQLGTDYWAEDMLVSPVQHYWSLAVEEQFYLVWPFLVALCVYIAVKRKINVRFLLGGIAGVVAVASFVYSWQLTSINQPLAYFGTPARAWQLAIGALLAAAAPLAQKIPAPGRNALAIIGLVGFSWTIVSLEESGIGYPGWIALIPTLSSALLLAAGVGGATVIGTALSWKPFVWVGDISYSLYLWHFPILILGIEYFAPAGWLVRTGLVLASVLAAWLTYVLVENPVRSTPLLAKRPAWVSLAVGLALVITSCGAAVITRPTQSEIASATTVTGLDGEPVALGDILMDPMDGFVPAPGCTTIGFEDSELGECNDYAAVPGDKQVIVLGDSHAANLAPGLAKAAEEDNWGMTVWAKPGCPIADVTLFNASRQTVATACDDFRAESMRRAKEQHPDLIVMVSAHNPDRIVVDRSTGERLDVETSTERITQGWTESIRYFTDAGIPVVVVADWPMSPERPADCLLRTQQVRECVFDWSDEGHLESRVVEDAASDLVRLTEIHDGFCDDTECSPVAGDLLVYRDTSHLTFPYMQSLSSVMKERILYAFD